MRKKARRGANKLILVFLGIVLIVLTLKEMTQTVEGWFWLIVLGSLAVVLAYLLKIHPARQKAEAYRALHLADVDNMSGEQFERYVNELLKAQGFKTEMTPARNDYGVDIVAERNGVRIAVQCKRYGENISASTRSASKA